MKTNISKESKGVTKYHFLSCTQYRSKKESKSSHCPRPCFKTVLAQTRYFGQRTIVFKTFATQNFIKKAKKSIKTIFYIAQNKSLVESVKFKTDRAHF